MEDFNPDKNYVVNKNMAMRKGVTNIPVPEEKTDAARPGKGQAAPEIR